MLNKICDLCKESLPKNQFTSMRAKFCRKCLVIHKLEKRNEMTLRSLERSKTKKQKTVGIIRLSDLKKTTQKAVNKWVRGRDLGNPCLACLKNNDDMDASHFIAQGSSGFLRYFPNNIHDTCTSCNRYKHGNLLEYRINLVNKIGEDKVKWLEDNRTKIHKYTREELEKIIDCCKRNAYGVECWYEVMHQVP